MQRFGSLFERVPLGYRSRDGRVLMVDRCHGRWAVVVGERETPEMSYREAKKVAVAFARELNDRGGINHGDYPTD